MNENIRCACGHPDLSVNTNQQFHVVLVDLRRNESSGKQTVRIA
jgi:hypothetical protein